MDILGYNGITYSGEKAQNRPNVLTGRRDLKFVEYYMTYFKEKPIPVFRSFFLNTTFLLLALLLKNLHYKCHLKKIIK